MPTKSFKPSNLKFVYIGVSWSIVTKFSMPSVKVFQKESLHIGLCFAMCSCCMGNFDAAFSLARQSFDHCQNSEKKQCTYLTVTRAPPTPLLVQRFSIPPSIPTSSCRVPGCVGPVLGESASLSELQGAVTVRGRPAVHMVDDDQHWHWQVRARF